jgi:AcrR family transcriptional regulator
MKPTRQRPAAEHSPRERLLQAATELFCRNGINAVGVDAIVEAAGTAKTTLYKLFGSKDGLVEAVLTAEGRAWRDWFVTAVEKAATTPHEKLDAIFPTLKQWFRQKRFYGCPFINAVAEHDKSSDRLRALALAHKHEVLAYIQALAVDAGMPDPDGFTHRVALLIDGAIVAAMITKNAGVADHAQDVMQHMMVRA